MPTKLTGIIYAFDVRRSVVYGFYSPLEKKKINKTYNKKQNVYKYCPEGFYFIFIMYMVFFFFLFICLFNKQSLSHQFMTATKRTRRGGRCLVFIYFIVFIPRAIIFQGVESNFLCQPLVSAPTAVAG